MTGLPLHHELGPDPEPMGVRDQRVRVLIAGAGVGGLETALALHTYGDHVRVDLLSDERAFTYRPQAVGEPFGGAATTEMDLGKFAAERGFGLIRDSLESVDPSAKLVATRGGKRLPYDGLVLALGAKSRAAVPGALMFRGQQDTVSLALALADMVTLPSPNITFVAGASATWTLPLYELALLTDAWAREHDFTPIIRVVTAEHKPLEAFGETTSEVLLDLLDRRGIQLLSDTIAGFVEGGQLWIQNDGLVPADLAVALPRLEGSLVPGVPADPFGFVEVDSFCRVKGLEDVYAVGDMTTSDVKQGGLATQMADAAAASIASAAGAPVEPAPFTPVLRGLLFTGERPLLVSGPAARMPRPAGDGVSVADWWPSHKIVGTHLGPYLATHAEMLVPASP